MMTPRRIDQELVRCAQRGDRAAFELLVAKYQRKLVRLLSHFVVDAGEAERLAQTAFLQAYNELSSFPDNSEFPIWLYKIGIKLAKDCAAIQIRSPHKTGLYAEGALRPQEKRSSAASISSEDESEEVRIMKAVRAALQNLPEELRAAITLREIEGLGYDEIATCMGCPIEIVRLRIFEARQFISERLHQESWKRKVIARHPNRGSVSHHDSRSRTADNSEVRNYKYS